MSPNQKVSLILALSGFVILLLGSWGYMGVYSLSEVVSYILMIVGVLMIIASMAVIYLLKEDAEGIHAAKEE